MFLGYSLCSWGHVETLGRFSVQMLWAFSNSRFYTQFLNLKNVTPGSAFTRAPPMTNIRYQVCTPVTFLSGIWIVVFCKVGRSRCSRFSRLGRSRCILCERRLELMGYSGWQAAAAAAGGPTLTFRARINGQPGPRPGSRRVHLQRKVCEESAATNSQATSWSIHSSLIVGKATRVGVFFWTVTIPVKL